MIQFLVNGRLKSTMSNWQFFKDAFFAMLAILFMGYRQTRTYIGADENLVVSFKKVPNWRKVLPVQEPVKEGEGR